MKIGRLSQVHLKDFGHYQAQSKHAIAELLTKQRSSWCRSNPHKEIQSRVDPHHFSIQSKAVLSLRLESLLGSFMYHRKQGR